MNSNAAIQTLISFIVLLLLQEFVFDNIELGVYVNMPIYVMFILLLPTTFSPLAVLLLSGLMGISVDLFSGGIIGLNMAACLLTGFLRPVVLKTVTTSSDAPQEVPVMYRVETRKVLSYTVLLVFIHCLALFSLEVFSWSKIIYILIRTVASTAITVLFIIVFELFIYRK